jgi:hypothetical protein
MHRPNEDAGRLLGSIARAALAFGVRLHIEDMPQEPGE